MSPKSWEQAMTEAYWDYRWRQIMEPLCDTFQRWKAGKLRHADVDRAIDAAYKEKCAINSVLGQRHDRAAAIIRCWDSEWFEAWLEENRPTADVESSEPLAEGCGEVNTIDEVPDP
jgi:hypothetical protein